MSNEETVDSTLLEQTKKQIRQLVTEIAELAEADLPPGEFYQEFLTRTVAAVAALGGAVWLKDLQGNLRLQHQINYRQTGFLDRNGDGRPEPHDALLRQVILDGQPRLALPDSHPTNLAGGRSVGNPSEFALLVAPLPLDDQVMGIVELVVEPARHQAVSNGTIRFVTDLCDLAASYLKNRQLRQMMDQSHLWGQLDTYTQQIHQSLNPVEVAYQVANEGKRLIECDRLTVALMRGQKCVLQAISGQEVVEARANLIRSLSRLTKAVIRSGEDLHYTGEAEDLVPPIRDRLQEYVDESSSKTVQIILLREPVEDGPATEGKPFGALIVEQIGDHAAPLNQPGRIEMVARHSATALFNALEHDRIFLRPVWSALGRPREWIRGRKFLIGSGIVLLLAVAGVALAVVPYPLRLQGQGEITPEDRRKIYAPHEGMVMSVHYEHGARVIRADRPELRAGKNLQPLATLVSPDLLIKQKAEEGSYDQAVSEIARINAQLARPSNPREPDDRQQLNGQLLIQKAARDNAKQQLELLKQEIDSLQCWSPIDGVVTTWEVRRSLLGKPVQQGEELLTVADTRGPWVLEIKMPEENMGPILDAWAEVQKHPGTRLPVDFILASEPDHHYKGHVTKVATKSELVEAKSIVMITAAIDDQGFPRHPGAEVRAKVVCGKRALGYVLFRDVLYFMYENVLF